MEGVDRGDSILGNVLVERGWLDRDELAQCFEECERSPEDTSRTGAASPFCEVLLRRRLIPEDEFVTLRAEISKILAPGRFGHDRGEDLLLGRFLLSAGR